MAFYSKPKHEVHDFLLLNGVSALISLLECLWKRPEPGFGPHVPACHCELETFRSAHLNHTEEQKRKLKKMKEKRSYIKTVELKTRDTEFIVLHIITACPCFLMFSIFWTPVHHLLSLFFFFCLIVSRSDPPTHPNSLCTAGLVMSLQIAKGLRVTLVEVCTETSGLLFLYVNRHTQICRG